MKGAEGEIESGPTPWFFEEVADEAIVRLSEGRLWRYENPELGVAEVPRIENFDFVGVPAAGICGPKIGG